MYKPKHSKLETHDIYDFYDLQDFFVYLLSEFDTDDLFILPIDFLESIRKYIILSNSSLEGKIKYKKHD